MDPGALISAVEFLRGAFQKRGERGIAVFDVFVKPTFDLLKPVKHDYDRGLDEVCQWLADPALTLADVRGRIERRRREYLPDRQLLAKLQQAYVRSTYSKGWRVSRPRKAFQSEAFQYALHLLHFLYQATDYPDNYSFSAYRSVSLMLRAVDDGTLSRDEAIERVNEVRASIDERWERAADAYANLSMMVLG